MHSPDILPHVETEAQLGQRWHTELLEQPNFSPQAVTLEWQSGSEYRTRPFRSSTVRQVFAVGTQHPSSVVYNISKPLDFRQQEYIRDTYQWFYDHVGLDVFEASPHVVIGRHLKPLHDGATKKPRKRLGMYDAEHPQPILSLNAEIFEEGRDIPEAMRYHELLRRGIPLPEIILGHELIHALMGMDEEGKVEELFADYAKWIERAYETSEGIHIVRGLGYLASGEPSMAVTELGFTEPGEDAAEAGTFYRFVPDFIGAEREAFMTGYFKTLQKHGQADPLPGSRVHIVKLPEPVFPQW